MDLLEVRNLQVSFPARNGITKALNGVSFSLKKGEILGIVGESGSGKSLTAMAILRLIGAPRVITVGEIMLEGTDILRMSQQQLRRVRGREIFLVFQSPRSTLNPTMKIGRQILEPLVSHCGMAKDRAAARTVEVLREVGIGPERGDSYPFQLSGGMQQRVLIAMALALRPKILIADEPTTGLDAITQKEVLLRLRNLRDELGMAVILITHDLRVVSFLADRLAVMRAGSILECEDTPAVLGFPRSAHALDLITAARRLAFPEG